MTHMTSTEIRKGLGDALNRVAYRGDRIIVRRNGKDVAALMPTEDLAMLEELEDRMDVEAARKALKEKGPSIPWSQLKKELGL